MIFLGFLIVKNKLKEKTKEYLTKYDEADLRMLMATGDNIFTAISVSKECNLIIKDQEMFTCELENNQNGKEILKWKRIEEGEVENYEEDFNDNSNIISKKENTKNKYYITSDINQNISLLDLYPYEIINSNYKPELKVEDKKENDKNPKNNKKLKIFDDDKRENNIIQPNDNIVNSSRISNKSQEISLFDIKMEDSPWNVSENENFGIALTGSIFEKLFKLNEKYVKSKDPKLKLIHQSYRIILKNARVFARMSPEHKALLIEALKKEGFITLMCGDGANDCSALRTANVGVSLSAEEASIAAGFTSIIPDVSCIFDLLREGKCSLTTSIQTFKYDVIFNDSIYLCNVDANKWYLFIRFTIFIIRFIYYFTF